MSGSARSTATAVLHRGHRYAPGAPHQPLSQSQWLVDVNYGGLRDEVPRGDVEWDVGEGEDLDLNLEEFDIDPPRGVRREAAERSRRRRDEEAYMEGVRREHLGSAYMEEPRHSHRDSMEEMDVACEYVGEADGNLGRPRGRRSWSLRPRMPPCGKT